MTAANNYHSLSLESETNSQHEEERIVLHVYDDESKEFSSLTTYHGMIRIYTSETWPSRIFWGVVVITCVTLFMIQGGVLLEFYHSHPTAIKTVEKRINFSSLPAVSFCPHGFKKEKKLFHVITEMQKKISNQSSDWDQSSKDVVLANSFTCEDMLESYLTDTGREEKICERINTTLSPLGVCFTFTGWKSMISSSLKIKLKNSFKSLFTAHIHNISDEPSHVSTQIRLDPGKISRIPFRLEEKKHLAMNDWGTCENSENGNQYNFLKCLNQCYVSGFLKGCGCNPFFDTTVSKHCTIREIHKCSRLELVQCNCPVQCVESNYLVRNLISSTNLEKETVVIFQLDSMLLKIHTQYKRFKQIDLMSYIGGVMGLFLGMSCITLLEVFIYLFKTVFGTLNSSRHEEFFERDAFDDNDINGSHEEIVITQRKKESTAPSKSDLELTLTDSGGRSNMLPKAVNQMSVKLQFRSSRHVLKRNSVYLGNCDF